MTTSHMDKFPYRITVWEYVYMVISSTSVQTALRMKPGTTKGQEKDKPETRLRSSEVNLDAKAMTEQECVDDCSGDGEEDGVVKPTEVSGWQVDSGLNRIVNTLGLRAPITAKYESRLQKLVKTGLEWSMPLQDSLAGEVAGVRREVGIPAVQALPGNEPFPGTSLD